MQLRDHDTSDGKRVWLTTDDVELLLSHADGTKQKIAIGLAVRSGLRASEVVSVKPNDVVETPGGIRIRVWNGKGDKYRETPLSTDLYASIEAYADVRPEENDIAIIDIQTRTLQRWVANAAQRCQDETEDEGWSYLTPHDLRRTWGTLLVESEVEPGMVMEWGGWDDWETFREHYLGAYSVKMQKEQIAKVDWL